MTTKNESKANQVNESANVQANAQVEPQVENVIKNTDKYLSANTKPTDVKRDVNGFKDGGTQIATATATKFEKLGKFIAKFQAIEAKDGGKTVYIFETSEKVFVGYTSSELSDVFGLEKRSYKKSESEPQESAVLRALKDFRITLADVQYFGFFDWIEIAKVDAAIIEQETTDKEKTQFESKFAANIPLFAHITEAVFLGLPNVTQSDLDTALKLGYRFSDTTDTDTDTDTAKEQEQEQEQERK